MTTPSKTQPSKPLALIVDDDPSVRTAVEYMVSSLGWETQTAHSATEALKQLKIRHFNAVIADVAMEEVDGIELCRLIHQEYGQAAPLVFMLSGYMDSATRNAAAKAGAKAFLRKPIGTHEFAEAFRKHGLPCTHP